MIELVEKQISEFIKELDSKSIEEKVKQLPSGKRVRAKLVLKIAGENKKSIKLAAIVELIHAASLLHDDVIDDANTRRGENSLNAIYGNKTAIMLGDILYSKAFNELCSYENKISKVISNSVTLLSIGELEDVELGDKFNDNENIYLNMIYKKTASLIEATCTASAMLVNKDEKIYAIYGKNLGLAFQIVDDILDITSSCEKLGKPVMNDYVEGKTTLPYIYLYETLDDNEKNKLKSMFKKKLDDKDKNWIKDSFIKHQSIMRTQEQAYNFSQKAIEKLDDEYLENLVLNMVNRDY